MSTIEPKTITEITSDLLVQFAEASGDDNPIHLDENVAKESGLPGRIAHGMLIAGLMNERVRKLCEEELGGAWRLWQIQFRFKAMTFLGEKIGCDGKMIEETDSEKKLQIFAKNEQGEVKASAKVTLKTSS